MRALATQLHIQEYAGHVEKQRVNPKHVIPILQATGVYDERSELRWPVSSTLRRIMGRLALSSGKVDNVSQVQFKMLNNADAIFSYFKLTHETMSSRRWNTDVEDVHGDEHSRGLR